MNSKKAQSEIITTVLIILLVLAAIIIVWQVVQTTLKNTEKGIDYNKLCLGSQLSIVKAVANSSSGAIGNLTITREASTGNDDVVSAAVFINGVKSGTTIGPIAIYGKNVTSMNIALGDEVKVAPILTTDNYLCPATSTVHATLS